MAKTLDPKKVLVIVGGVPMSGFADGTFITVSRDEDSFTKRVGSDGEVARIKNANTTGSIVMTLLQSSASNDVLSGFLVADELSGAGVVPVLIKDLTGLTTIVTATAWVRKPADATFSKEVETREWTLDTGSMDIFTGGVA